jgi:hypothetical protein
VPEGAPVRSDRPARPARQERAEVAALAPPETATNAVKHAVYEDRHQRTKQRPGRQRGAKVAQIDIARRLTEAI